MMLQISLTTFQSKKTKNKSLFSAGARQAAALHSCPPQSLPQHRKQVSMRGGQRAEAADHRRRHGPGLRLDSLSALGEGGGATPLVQTQESRDRGTKSKPRRNRTHQAEKAGREGGLREHSKGNPMQHSTSPHRGCQRWTPVTQVTTGGAGEWTEVAHIPQDKAATPTEERFSNTSWAPGGQPRA